MKPQQFVSVLAFLCGLFLYFHYHAVAAAEEERRPFRLFKQQQLEPAAAPASNGILDTFSLSFVGNFNFANAVEGARKIMAGIANCECTLMQL